MSYILDALKKSEQQRGHGNIPDVQTVHSSSLNYRDEKRAYWPYILIVAIILNISAVIYFIIDRDAGPEHITAVESISHDIADKKISSVTQIPSAPEVVRNKPAIIPGVPEKAPVENSTPAQPRTPSPKKKRVAGNSISEKPEKPEPTVTGSNEKVYDDIVEYYDLPESTQRELPTITISAHVYSSNPQQRSIVINNKFLEEGDYVLDDLILLEITTDGGIFNYHGTNFHYGIVSSWQ
ncbi:MAG TPA: hypothetical protein ENJ87_05350 [Gammaproteobacteria bacterium]|nr:hypothetical protein [Gammaproteobacteria bacterium]